MSFEEIMLYITRQMVFVFHNLGSIAMVLIVFKFLWDEIVFKIFKSVMDYFIEKRKEVRK